MVRHLDPTLDPELDGSRTSLQVIAGVAEFMYPPHGNRPG